MPNPSTKTSWSNADLTPAAIRKRLGLEDHIDKQEMALQGQLAGPDEGLETDRLLNDAKGTLAKADPFARMLNNAGNVAGQQALQAHEGPGEAAARSLGDTAVGVAKGVTHIPGDLLGGVLGLPGAIAHGYESIPEGLQAIIDPATWRGMPDAAKQTFMELANDPEEATRLFGGMIAAGPAGDLAGMGLAKAPGVAGRAISKVGRGMQAAGQSPLVEGTGLLRKAGAVLHPGVGTVLAAVGPEMLTGAGKAVEGLGGRVSNIPNSSSLEALKRLANKDLGLAAEKAFTPALTAEEQAAAGVRATVDTAKRGVEGGLSRAQADQRAGWPLGKSSAEKHTTPGADVEAHRPYKPAVRGKTGNVIQEGRGTSLDGLRKAAEPDLFDQFQASQAGPAKPFDMDGQSYAADASGSHKAVSSLSALDDLAAPTNRIQRDQPTVYADRLLDQEGSRRYMDEQFKKNNSTAKAVRNVTDNAESERLMNAFRNHEAAADAQLDTHYGPEMDLSDETLSPLDRLARMSRGRSKAPAFATNTLLNEGRY
jgi:uncharacterized protein YjeT (DUF2065 family)